MYAKYRVYLQTTRGSYVMAAHKSVNGLVNMIEDWLVGTGVGRSIENDMIRAVIVYELDKNTGDYKLSERLPAASRKDILAKVRALGAR